MKKIYKYPLDTKDTQVLSIPGDILSVEVQHDNIVVYAVVDEFKPSIIYQFEMRGTGHTVGFDTDRFTFLGTVLVYSGSIVLHIFYCKIGMK